MIRWLLWLLQVVVGFASLWPSFHHFSALFEVFVAFHLASSLDLAFLLDLRCLLVR